MAHTLNRLSAVKVAKLNKPGRHADGGGLYLQISRAGTKSWTFRYMLNGAVHEMGLGPLGAISLAKARAIAAELRKQKWQGIDPLQKKREIRAQAKIEAAPTITFREAATAYIAARQSGWKNKKHAKQWSSTLEQYAYPVFGDLPVQSISVSHVTKAVEPIWSLKTETASRVRGRIEAVLDWAKARGYCNGENPARWRGHLENLLPARTGVHKVKHFPALPYPEISIFVSALTQRQGLAARALELLILTATRTAETLGARWIEFDLDQAVWTIPGERTKSGRVHRVPLGEPAVELLRKLQELGIDDEFVFPGQRRGKPLSNMAMLNVLARMKRNDITVHGFRSCFRDWAAELTGHGGDVVEMAIAHVVKNKVEAAYRRGDLFMKRKALMADWAGYCGQHHTPAEVVQLKRATPEAA